MEVFEEELENHVIEKAKADVLSFECTYLAMLKKATEHPFLRGILFYSTSLPVGRKLE